MHFLKFALLIKEKCHTIDFSNQSPSTLKIKKRVVSFDRLIQENSSNVQEADVIEDHTSEKKKKK